jgi:hypothetical protein
MFRARRPQSALTAVGERLRQVGQRMDVPERLREVGERIDVPERLRGVRERIDVPLVRARRRGMGGASIALLALLGAAAGAGLMFVLDPERGRRRRALIRDKVTSMARRTGDAVDGQSRHVVNRARGLVIEMRSRLPGTKPEPGGGSMGERDDEEPVNRGNRP